MRRITTIALALIASCAHAQIIEDTTWDLAGSPYIIVGEVAVGAGATLTIEPGVVVRFGVGEPQDRPSIIVGSDEFGPGALVAVGTPEQPITFTSIVGQNEWAGLEFANQTIDAAVKDGEYVSGSTLQHCIVQHAGGFGRAGAVVVERADVYVSDCQILDAHQCGLIYTGGANTVHVIDTLFERCTALTNPKFGGGVHILNGVDHVVRGCTFIDNEAAFDGGGLYASAGADFAELSHLDFFSNSADIHGGAMALAGGQSVSDSVFSFNQSDATGGALYGAGDVIRCEFASNFTRFQGGAANQCDAFLECEFTDNIALGNLQGFVPGLGGAVYGEPSTIEDCFFAGNLAVAGSGGAVYIESETESVAITGSTFIDNVAEEIGGALYIDAFFEDVLINACTFDGNSADELGGGAWISAHTTVADSLFINNTAETGAGLHLFAAVNSTITNTDFANNIAAIGAGGVCVCGQSKNVLVDQSTFAGNQAGSYGGGLAVDISDGFVMTRSDVIGNTADEGGGLWNESHNVDVSGSPESYNVIAANAAGDGADLFYAGGPNYTMNAASVCWGSSDLEFITARIWDHDDDPTVGAVDILPIVDCTLQCPADCNEDFVLNILDFVCFQIIFQAGAVEADCNNDGVLNILDFVCFQLAFEMGCQ